MSWISITPDHLKAYLVSAQLDALRTAALATGQGDPFAEVAPDVVAKVRQYIASNPANVLEAAENTIPPELKLDTVYLILAPMLGRLGIDLTEDQRAAVERAQATLSALRDRKLVVSRPAFGIAPSVQQAGGAQAVYSPRRFKTESFENL